MHLLRTVGVLDHKLLGTGDRVRAGRYGDDVAGWLGHGGPPDTCCPKTSLDVLRQHASPRRCQEATTVKSWRRSTPRDLLDSAEVADLLGLASRKVVMIYAKRYDDFPKPASTRRDALSGGGLTSSAGRGQLGAVPTRARFLWSRLGHRPRDHEALQPVTSAWGRRSKRLPTRTRGYCPSSAVIISARVRIPGGARHLRGQRRSHSACPSRCPSARGRCPHPHQSDTRWPRSGRWMYQEVLVGRRSCSPQQQETVIAEPNSRRAPPATDRASSGTRPWARFRR